jgi:hypothetical protein
MGCTAITIEGNRIGVDATGVAALPNSIGILLAEANQVRIGGTNASQRNTISGNQNTGINCGTSTNLLIVGNFIGLGTNGLQQVGNDDGIGIAQSCGTNIVIGTGAADGRNVISGNQGSGIGLYAPARVIGNYVGLTANGVYGAGNHGMGVIVFTKGAMIGEAGKGNVISDNTYDGIRFSNLSSGNRVQGNILGYDAGGTQPYGNLDNGISFYGGVSNLIGGAGAGEGNVIANSTEASIYARTGSAFNVIQGNWLGLGPNGHPGNSTFGVWLENTKSNLIGGTNSGEGNVISGNYIGVFMTNYTATSCMGNMILGNSIYSNQTLGIDFGGLGVTSNDSLDADTGANGFQNYPVLTNAWAGSTHIEGTFNSKPSQVYRLEFFGNATLNQYGLGEGQIYLGATNVTTDASGNAAIRVRFTRSTPQGGYVTATATDPGGNTSEFSATRVVAQAADTDGNGIADHWEQLYFGGLIGVAATNDPDTDGFTTRDEYQADTHPINGTSRLKLLSVQGGTACTVTFTSSVGRVYSLQQVSPSAPTEWTNVAGQVDRQVSGSTGSLSDTGAGAATSRWYRVRARVP